MEEERRMCGGQDVYGGHRSLDRAFRIQNWGKPLFFADDAVSIDRLISLSTHTGAAHNQESLLTDSRVERESPQQKRLVEAMTGKMMYPPHGFYMLFSRLLLFVVCGSAVGPNGQGLSEAQSETMTTASETDAASAGARACAQAWCM